MADGAAIATTTEAFRCIPLGCVLTRSACGRRHLESRAGGHRGKVTLIAAGCTDCPVGLLHSGGHVAEAWPGGAPLELRALTAPAPPSTPPASRPAWLPEPRRRRVEVPVAAQQSSAARPDANAATGDRVAAPIERVRSTTARDGGERPASTTAPEEETRMPMPPKMVKEDPAPEPPKPARKTPASPLANLLAPAPLDRALALLGKLGVLGEDLGVAPDGRRVVALEEAKAS